MNNTKRNKPCRSRNIMYVQKLADLPFATVEELAEHIKKNLSVERFAIMVHNADVYPDGRPVPVHLHCFLHFKNPRCINAVAKILRDEPQYLKQWDYDELMGYCSLTLSPPIPPHNLMALQYCPRKVIANFDYPALLFSNLIVFTEKIQPKQAIQKKD